MRTDTPAEQGYDAAYDGFKRNQNPFPQSSDDWAEWDQGYAMALGEIEEDNWNAGDREDFDSGRWTAEDTRSMETGRDIPLRNDAGEWMV